MVTCQEYCLLSTGYMLGELLGYICWQCSHLGCRDQVFMRQNTISNHGRSVQSDIMINKPEHTLTRKGVPPAKNS